MARTKMLEESRKVPIVSYTTESHARRIRAHVAKEGKGATLSAWLLQLIDPVVPMQVTAEEPTLTHA